MFQKQRGGPVALPLKDGSGVARWTIVAYANLRRFRKGASRRLFDGCIALATARKETAKSMGKIT